MSLISSNAHGREHARLVEEIHPVPDRNMGDGSGSLQTDHSGPDAAEGKGNAVQMGTLVRSVVLSRGGGGPGHYFHAVRTMKHFMDGKPYTLPAEATYKTDTITDFAVKFIAEAATKPQPFFLYVAEYAPHWPLHAKEQDMARYRDLYRKLGWDEARAQRHKRLIELGLINKNCPLSPRDLRAGVRISMDGRGRCLDNIFVERLWRTVKYEEVYPHEYENGWMAEDLLGRYFEFYNQKRPHQSLDWHTPAERYFGGGKREVDPEAMRP